MGIAVTKIGDRTMENYREFIVDTVDDLESLPSTDGCCAGSKAYCSANGVTYTLETDGDWVAPSGGGGSALPEVTSTDNGDVLTVVDGAWAKAAPSGGSGEDGVFVVHDVYIEGEQGAGETRLDKTWQEISDAFENGQLPVIFQCEDGWNNAFFITDMWSPNYDGDVYGFHAYAPNYYESDPLPYPASGVEGYIYTADSSADYPIRDDDSFASSGQFSVEPVDFGTWDGSLGATKTAQEIFNLFRYQSVIGIMEGRIYKLDYATPTTARFSCTYYDDYDPSYPEVPGGRASILIIDDNNNSVTQQELSFVVQDNS